MKSQDIVVLLKIVSLQEQQQDIGFDRLAREAGDAPYSMRSLAAALGISKTEIANSINRSIHAGLAAKDASPSGINPNLRDLRNFIIHGLRFVFPAEIGPVARGLPTGFAAPVLKDLLTSAGRYIYVWPDPHADEAGQTVQPLYKSVAAAAKRDERLYAYLALVDAIRLGNQREAGLAAEMLTSRLAGR